MLNITQGNLGVVISPECSSEFVSEPFRVMCKERFMDMKFRSRGMRLDHHSDDGLRIKLAFKNFSSKKGSLNAKLT